ncbi:MAG: flavoprotein [Pirellulaceae bacterium]
MNDSTTPSREPAPRVVVGVGGGVAAYKSAALVSRLTQSGVDVRVVMTSASEKFIGSATFAALSGHPVATDLFASGTWPLGPHIELADKIDLLCIAPATADLIGKLANGIADTLLTTLYLQATCQTLIAPAMSNQMWVKPSVQRNVRQLSADGVHQIGPEEGWLSCRQRGPGRMSEPDQIAERVLAMLRQE